MISDNGSLKKRPLKSRFPSAGTLEEKCMYMLFPGDPQSAATIAGRIAELEEEEKVLALEEHVELALTTLLKEGRVSGSLDEQVMMYRLPENK
jgi:hypothetical protein